MMVSTYWYSWSIISYIRKWRVAQGFHWSNSCWMTWKKHEDTRSWSRKLRISLFGELSLKEAMDLSQDRLLLDLILDIPNSHFLFGFLVKIGPRSFIEIGCESLTWVHLAHEKTSILLLWTW
jgi:hypothetical protein